MTASLLPRKSNSQMPRAVPLPADDPGYRILHKPLLPLFGKEVNSFNKYSKELITLLPHSSNTSSDKSHFPWHTYQPTRSPYGPCFQKCTSATAINGGWTLTVVLNYLSNHFPKTPLIFMLLFPAS
jgi:hypothetical protein